MLRPRQNIIALLRFGLYRKRIHKTDILFRNKALRQRRRTIEGRRELVVRIMSDGIIARQRN